MVLEAKVLPAAIRYSTFQIIRWLQRIRSVVERAERAIMEDAQCAHDEGERGAVMSQYVSSLLLAIRYGTPDAIDLRDTLAIFHTIAREVYMIQQKRAAATTSECHDTEDTTGCIVVKSDVALYRVCGAQLYRMINVHKQKIKGNCSGKLDVTSELTEIGAVDNDSGREGNIFASTCTQTSSPSRSAFFISILDCPFSW